MKRAALLCALILSCCSSPPRPSANEDVAQIMADLDRIESRLLIYQSHSVAWRVSKSVVEKERRDTMKLFSSRHAATNRQKRKRP